MELGALVCLPRNPKCAECPVSEFCSAFAQNRQNELPFKSPKKAPTPLFDVCALALDAQGQVLLRRRPDEAGVWWRGMWELPRTTRAEGENAGAALARLGQELAIDWRADVLVTALKHGVTRFQIELECWRVAADSVEERENLRWFSMAEALELPLPSTMKTLLQRAQKHGDAAPATQLCLGLE